MNLCKIYSILQSEKLIDDCISIIFKYCGDIEKDVDEQMQADKYGWYKLTYKKTNPFAYKNRYLTEYFCDICRSFSEINNWNQHSSSKKHRKQIRKYIKDSKEIVSNRIEQSQRYYTAILKNIEPQFNG